MTERVEQVTQTTQSPLGSAQEVSTTEITRDDNRKSSVAARIIGFITALMLALLAIRFTLLVLGANTSNGFVSFILDLTGWMVAPFNGIFGNPVDDVRFEPQTLVAIVVYGLVGYGLMRLVTLLQPKH